MPDISIDPNKVEFHFELNARTGPNQTTYHVISLAWATEWMVKSLADCGNADDPRNREFVEWLITKLEAARDAGEALPFLRERLP